MKVVQIELNVEDVDDLITELRRAKRQAIRQAVDRTVFRRRTDEPSQEIQIIVKAPSLNDCIAATL